MTILKATPTGMRPSNVKLPAWSVMPDASTLWPSATKRSSVQRPQASGLPASAPSKIAGSGVPGSAGM
ncbi:MAG: hypothetical protein IPN77_27725 [Sandaracinaceae bacterium]|nr:hypothetical protein [Sandaracinaceae bacterium]